MLLTQTRTYGFYLDKDGHVSTTPPESEMVNHPNHYVAGGIEVLAVIQAKSTPEQYVGFLYGNAIKYLLRFQHKGKPLEDLKKSAFYLNALIENFADDKK